MKLSNETYIGIKNKLVDFVESYDIEYPLDVHGLVLKMGFHLIPYSNLKFDVNKISGDGFSKYIEEFNTFVICFNDIGVMADRQRFTICHEIGHIILNRFEQSKEVESMCDYFAGLLLCPPALLEKYKLYSIEVISNVFKISKTCAMAAKNNWYHTFKKNQENIVEADLYFNKFTLSVKYIRKTLGKSLPYKYYRR